MVTDGSGNFEDLVRSVIGTGRKERRLLAGLIDFYASALAQDPDDAWAKENMRAVRARIEKINAEVVYRQALKKGSLPDLCRAFTRRFGVIIATDPFSDPEGARAELESAQDVERLLAEQTFLEDVEAFRKSLDSLEADLE